MIRPTVTEPSPARPEQPKTTPTFRRYAAERVAAFLVLLLAAVSLVFLMFHVIDRPPDLAPNPRYIRFAHESFGDFIWRLIGHGSLAHSSLDGGASFTVPIIKASLVTLSLVGGALLLALLIGIPLGVAWAKRPRIVGRPASVFAYVTLGLTPILLAVILPFYFGFKLGWFPLTGYCDFFNSAACSGPAQWAHHLILPSIALGIPLAGLYSRVVNGLARGVRRIADAERRAAARRTAQIVLAKRLLRDSGYLIGGTILVEDIFRLPGLGRYFIQYVEFYDPPVEEGVVVFAALLALGLHLVGDLIGAAVTKEWREI
jgi:peptide/nickel transport system permease protein